MNRDTFGRRELFKRAASVGAAGLGMGVALGVNEAHAQAPEIPLAAKVPTKKLGTTGEDIPILLMGGSNKFDMTFDKMLHRAHKMGMYYIDGGRKYGSGAAIGVFLEQVGRDNVWLTSKSGLWGGNDPDPWERYHDDFIKELADLKTDHMDMYFLHGIKHTEVLGPDYMKMADRLKKEGKTKYFGFSCHDGNVVDLMNKAATIGGDGINAIMFRYNFTMYGDLELNKAMDACVKAGIGLIGMKTQSSVPKDGEMVKKFQSNTYTLHQARLKAAWADERITACVSGINNMKILKENSTAARSQVELTAKEMTQLHRFAAQTADQRCQGCSEICETCVDGNLKIADQLRYLMYDDSYGDHGQAQALYRALDADQRDFEGVDLSAAMRACPQGINIAERLAEAKVRLA